MPAADAKPIEAVATIEPIGRKTSEQKLAACLAAVKGKADSVPKGTVDLWPLLRLPDNDLAAKVTAGECDGVLSELGELAAAHPVPKGEGLAERGTVLNAIKARARKA